MKLTTYKISYDNTNIRKLWILARNGVFDRRMVKDILKTSDFDYIYFKSEHSYKKFKDLEFTSLAMY